MGISAAAILGALLAPAWADAETVKFAAMFDSNGALDASSLGGVHTGLAPAPGQSDEDELRRKLPSSSDADPLRTKRDGNVLPPQSDLSRPFTPTLNNGAPINQQPAQNPPPANNNPPVASNPPPANNNPAASNPPPAQNTIPITNTSTLGSIITGTMTTILLRNGLLQ